MSSALDIATADLLNPGGLGEAELQATLGQLMDRHLDLADIYFQATRFESWALEDGIVKEGSFNIDQGVGVRAVSGEKTGFAYSDEIVLPALAQSARAARAIAHGSGSGKIQAWRARKNHDLYTSVDPLASLTEQQRISLLESVDAFARALDPRVKEVNVSLSGEYTRVMMVASDGTFSADVRPLVRLNVSVIVEQKGRREQAGAGGGGRYGYGYFQEQDRACGYAREAVRRALVNLESGEAPAGAMTVVLGPGWPGVLLHEAIGHGLEGDFNRKGSSAFSGRVGELVASPLCSVVDDGTLDGLRGSLSIDDEGCPTERTVLIENGVLKGYMQDKMNARLMGTRSTGNGRRQSYGHLPIPRMTNTFMLAGEHVPEEIIASVQRGLYATNFGGGSVDITSGRFVFSATEAYLIENGKVTRPVKGATLIGNGPEVMGRISMVGTDLALDQGVGICGKDGQSVPVGVGQPTLKIDEVIVGGTDAS